MAKQDKKDEVKEPSVIIKPIGKYGGLDNVHLALLGLVIIMFVVLLVVSYSKEIVIRNITNNITCTYGETNGTCVYPIHNASQIKLVAEKFIASYSNVNTSLSILPYYSNVSKLNASYLPTSSEWYVSVPVENPSTNIPFIFSMLISDKNLSVVNPFIQTIKTTSTTNDYVASQGVVGLAGKVYCSTQKPLQVWWIMDPYNYGSVPSLLNETALENRFGSSINITTWILYSQSSEAIASTYGTNNTQALGQYIFCASQQSRYANFSLTLNQQYSNAYISPATLNNIAVLSGLNMTSMNSCLNTAPETISKQHLLIQYYNITSSPVVVTDCEYQSIPETAAEAICYSNSTLC